MPLQCVNVLGRVCASMDQLLFIIPVVLPQLQAAVGKRVLVTSHSNVAIAEMMKRVLARSEESCNGQLVDAAAPLGLDTTSFHHLRPADLVLIRQPDELSTGLLNSFVVDDRVNELHSAREGWYLALHGLRALFPKAQWQRQQAQLDSQHQQAVSGQPGGERLDHQASVEPGVDQGKAASSMEAPWFDSVEMPSFLHELLQLEGELMNAGLMLYRLMPTAQLPGDSAQGLLTTISCITAAIEEAASALGTSASLLEEAADLALQASASGPIAPHAPMQQHTWLQSEDVARERHMAVQLHTKEALAGLRLASLQRAAAGGDLSSASSPVEGVASTPRAKKALSALVDRLVAVLQAVSWWPLPIAGLPTVEYSSKREYTRAARAREAMSIAMEPSLSTSSGNPSNHPMQAPQQMQQYFVLEVPRFTPPGVELPPELLKAAESRGLIDQARIVFCSVATVGSPPMQFWTGFGFDTVVIDEAAQLCEAATSIVLQVGGSVREK